MGYKVGSILGDVFNFSQKSQALLDNIANLAKGDGEWNTL